MFTVRCEMCRNNIILSSSRLYWAISEVRCIPQRKILESQKFESHFHFHLELPLKIITFLVAREDMEILKSFDRFWYKFDTK